MKIARTIFCLCMAVLFCQLPSFSKQYALRLEAHFFELQKVVEAYSLSVFKAAKSCEGNDVTLFDTCKAHGQADVEFADFLQNRYTRFKKALENISTSNAVFHPLWMAWGFDAEIGKESWQGYSPSVFFNAATFIWGVLGAFLGDVCIWIFCKMTKRSSK